MLKRILFVATLLCLAASIANAAGPGEIHRAQPGKKVDGEYIVVLNDGFAAEQVAEGLAKTFGGTVAATWSHALNGAHLKGMNERQAEALARHPMVTFVEENAVVELESTHQCDATWGLDRVNQRSVTRDGEYTYNHDGTGVDVYVIDTGIRTTHNEFGGRASWDADFVGDGQSTDCNGHGTHVAATIGGATYGVAKKARLHSVRVLNCSGKATWATVIAGINWVTANATTPAVANVSIGGGISSATDNALNNSVNAGIFYAVAAGNDNENACNHSPARATQAYTVAASDATDRRATFSNFGACVDIFAPGVSITSAWNSSNSATAVKNGTSMAAPHVAGVAALILDEHPTWTVTDIRDEIDDIGSTNRVTDPAGSPNLLLYSLTASDADNLPDTPSSLNVINELCYGLNSLDWSSVSGATRYDLYGSSSSSFTSQYLEYSGSNTSDFVNVSGTTYFRVRACNAYGCSCYRKGNRSAKYTNGCF